jgi:integrase
MARTVRNVNLESRAARSRLKSRRKPYWRSLDQGAHLGYYRGARGGTWIARAYIGRDRDPKSGHKAGYVEAKLGAADDTLEADGVAALNFRQAQAKARAWFIEQARRASGHEPLATGPYTVDQALDDYLAWYRRHRKALEATTTACSAHIRPALGSLPLTRLTAGGLRAWLSKLVDATPRRRTPKGAQPPSRSALIDAEGHRKRRATANRVLTVLKAALNHAWREGKISSDEAWRRVAPFRDVDAPVVRYLSLDECVRLVNSCPEDFRPMVRAAMLTGCRYGELIALQVSDFNFEAGTLSIRVSKSGKARHVVLTDEGRDLLSASVAGRSAAELIFTRPDGGPWGKSHQQRRLGLACKRAGIKPAISFHVLRHTHGSTLAMRGVPLAVIARQLGHADTRMTERHYAHLAPSYLADTIRAGFPTLGIVEASRVVPLQHGKQ